MPKKTRDFFKLLFFREGKRISTKVTKLLELSKDLQKPDKPPTISAPPRLYFSYSLIDEDGGKILEAVPLKVVYEYNHLSPFVNASVSSFTL